MKLPIYVIIETGYEGIESLCYLTDDPEKAKIIKKREEERIVDEKKQLLAMDKEMGLSEDYLKQMEARLDEARDFICIQKWDGKQFDCACGELGVQPSKLMLR